MTKRGVDRVVVLAFAVVLSLNVVDPSYAAYVGMAGLVYLVCRFEANVVLATLAVSGLFMFALLKDKFDISASMLVIVQTGVMALQIARLKQGTQGATWSRSSVLTLEAWCAGLVLLIALQYWTGPGTPFSDFLFQYFLVYFLYYVVAGILIVKASVAPESLVLPSVLFMGAIYPLINMSILNLSSAVGLSQYGLRTVDNFGAIAHDRVAAQFLVLSAGAFVLSRNRLALLPETVVGCAVSLPIVWYSYTRQSLLGAFVGIGLMFMKTAFRGRGDISRRERLLLAGGIGVVLLLGAHWVSSEIQGDSATRIGQTRLLSTEDLSSQTRVDLYRYSWDHIKRRPVLGYGLGGFADLYEGSGVGAWPHNWFLEAWLEYGVAGLLLLVIAATFVVVKFATAKGVCLSGWMLLGVFWLFLVQFSANIPQNSPLFLFIVIAFLYREHDFPARAARLGAKAWTTGGRGRSDGARPKSIHRGV